MTTTRTARAGALALALLLSFASATTYLQLDLPTILERAEIAFVGTVVATEVEARDGLPWTVVTFRVEEALRGVEPEGEVRLAFLGGTLPDGSSLSVNLMPQFGEGERVLAMAYEREAYSPVVGFRQGLWRAGELGFRDESGQLLSVDEEGLVADGRGASEDALFEALREAFGEGP